MFTKAMLVYLLAQITLNHFGVDNQMITFLASDRYWIGSIIIKIIFLLTGVDDDVKRGETFVKKYL